MRTRMIPKRLLAFRSTIVTINPNIQAIPYDASAWKAYFPGDTDVLGLIQMFPRVITRGDIKTLSARAVAKPTLVRKLFLATMMWGFGKRGFGPYRTDRMLRTPLSASILQQTVTNIMNGKIITAYHGLLLDRCGPVFSTKFLYFVGLGAKSDPLPVVLDTRVAQSLDLLNLNLASFGCHKLKNGIRVGRSPAGYVKYVNLINAWARQIGCRTDAIELFLFAPPPAFQSWICSSGGC